MYDIKLNKKWRRSDGFWGTYYPSPIIKHLPNDWRCFLTWDDDVVEGPGNSGWWDASDPTGQQEAFPLVECHISEQLGEDRVGMNRQGHRPTVLPDCITGNTGITAFIVRLVRRGDEDRQSEGKKSLQMHLFDTRPA